MNEKPDIKSQRITGYFLEAAKQIITTEGVENISARKIADIAGYSYATIYNYFKDIDELLGQTKALMVAEVMKHMMGGMSFTPKNIDDVKTLITFYIRYHLEHPQIFKFFYFYRLPGDEPDKEHYDFSAQWEAALLFLVEGGKIKKDEIEPCAKTLLYSIHGLMALYLSGNGLTEKTLFTNLDNIIDFILRR